MSAPRRSGVRTLTAAKALAAVANPFRARIMEALKVDGPSTTSAIARLTGLAVGSASHHLKVLHEADLIEEAHEFAKDRRERWWRLSSPGTRWSRTDFAGDTAALSAAWALAALDLQRQVERAQAWLAGAESAPEWDTASFSTQHWLRMSTAELDQLAHEVIELFTRWARREIPDDGVERQPVFVFARGFPAQP